MTGDLARNAAIAPPSTMDSNITLWQFLLEMLNKGEHPHLIKWSSNDGEFKLLDAEKVAQLWGRRKNKPHMNYDKLSRALRYYYDKNIIKKVNGQKFVYRFVVQEGSSKESFHYPIPKIESSIIENAGAERGTVVTQLHPHLSSTSSAFTSIEEPHSMNFTSISNNLPISTPSPANSSCTPDSVDSSSGVSSGGPHSTHSADMSYQSSVVRSTGNVHPALPSTSHHYPCGQQPTRPISTSSTHSNSTVHTETADLIQSTSSRKRKSPMSGTSAEQASSTAPKVVVSAPLESKWPNSSSDCSPQTMSANGATPSLKRPKPRPLNLTAAQSLNIGSGVPSASLNSASLLAQSPYLMQNGAAVPYTATSPLITYLNAAASAATLSASCMLNSSPFFLTAAACSPMFGAALSSPVTQAKMTPPAPSTPLHFQFPPNPQQMAAMANAAAIMSSPMFPFFGVNLNGNGCQNYSRSLVNRSPESLKTPVVIPKDF